MHVQLEEYISGSLYIAEMEKILTVGKRKKQI